MSGLFTDQVAIVTGGGQGLGEGIAKMLSDNGAATVVIFDINEEKGRAVAKSLRNGLFCKVDVSSEDSVKAGFDTVRATCGRLDIMVNSAAIFLPLEVKTEDMETASFDRVYEVNVRGSFLMTKYSLPEMRKNSYGRILLVASLAGKQGRAGMCAYSCSKAAVIGLAKSAGKEYAETGITVNSLAPALISTGMGFSTGPEMFKLYTQMIPMKRSCTVEEVASITKFIVSREASFNTGVCFDLSGGIATY